MVSYWNFDDGTIGETFGTCDDSKGTNDGTNNGALWFANNDLTLPVNSPVCRPPRQPIKIHRIIMDDPERRE